MSHHHCMGATNKRTNEYEYPKIANKIDTYKCPTCDKDVIFRKGKIYQAHFAHKKSNSPCNYYDSPSESEVHKHGKLLIQTLLNKKQPIMVYRKCNGCPQNQQMCALNLTSDQYTDDMCAVEEHKFKYNNSYRSADVALLRNNEILVVFEIFHTSKTQEENRPEPWVEIHATDITDDIPLDQEGRIQLECIRTYQCDKCLLHQKKLEYLRQKRIQDEEKNAIERQINEEARKLERQKEKEEMEQQRKKNQEERELKRKKDEKKRFLQLQKEKRAYELQCMQERDDEKQNNKKCVVCKINHCKCANPKIRKGFNNKYMCSICNRYICMCRTNNLHKFFKPAPR